MGVTALTRGPAGVRFEAEPATTTPRLPRMDVAAFVGFAAAGPLDLPVAVSDPAEYEAIFGGDVELAWDGERGEPVPGQLAPAVRAFFANGGRRALIVRVADRTTAEYSTVPLPGVLVQRRGAQLRDAVAYARSPGSWFDNVGVGAGLRSVAVPVEGTDPLRVRRGAVMPGDLLRLRTTTDTVMAVVAGASPSTPDLAHDEVTLDEHARVLLADPSKAPAGEGTATFADRAGHRRTGVRAARIEHREATACCILVLGPERAPQPGTFVRVCLADAPLHLWLVADGLEALGQVELGGGDPVPAVRVTGPAAWVRPDAGAAGDLAPVTAERLTLELSVRTGGRRVVLSDLGLAPGHPRYLGDLPTDAQLFGERAPGAAGDPFVWGAAATPRFPLAGVGGACARQNLASGGRESCKGRSPREETIEGRGVFFPVGVGPASGPVAGPHPTVRPAVRRDGLETFDPTVFGDPALAGVGEAALAARADHLRWQGDEPRLLLGVHALLHLDEPALIALPDIAQRPWVPSDPPKPSTPPASEPPPDLPHGFTDCGRHRIEPAPALSAPMRAPDGGLRLDWSASAGEPGLGYTLQETAGNWDEAVTVFTGSGTSTTLYRSDPRRRAYRVRAEAGANVSAWSNTLLLQAAAASRPVLATGDAQAPEVAQAVRQRLAVHADALRMCGARGDMLAILSLPRDDRAMDAARHAASLRAAVEARTAGFGAIHHPWIATTAPDGGGPAVATPPAGAVTGTIAHRTLARGVWIAAGNERLAGVVELASDWDGPAPDGVNEVVSRPVGFACLSQDTLHADPDERPINVRRLIALVRRLVVREGTRFVFEPNDPVLRRAIERGFGEVLRTLQDLGAFAGATADQSYRVRVRAPEDGDTGELLVELAIAPSRPLRFIVVRLRHAGDGGTVLETGP